MKKKLLPIVTSVMAVAVVAAVAVIILLPKGQNVQAARTAQAADRPVILEIEENAPCTITNAAGKSFTYDGSHPQVTGDMKIQSEQWTPTEPVSYMMITTTYSPSFTYKSKPGGKGYFAVQDKKIYSYVEEINADRVTIATSENGLGKISLSGSHINYKINMFCVNNGDISATLTGKADRAVVMENHAQGISVTGTSGLAKFTRDTLDGTKNSVKSVEFVQNSNLVLIGNLAKNPFNTPLTVSGAKVVR